MKTYESKVPTRYEAVTTHEIHLHLGDILPADLFTDSPGDYSSTIKVVIHYFDNGTGRDRTKVITLQGQDVL